ncbi:MAG: class I SAM-dependent methyltransferase [Bacteroidetes bacterium]|jgi:hypothetical protein|nr:MAG: class I SAM-dependent methyltransferase [Bacteroidota bacterium]
MLKKHSTLSLIQKGFVCAEIGVWQGDFSSQILSKRPKKLHLIDPWASQPHYQNRLYSIDQTRMDAIFYYIKRHYSDWEEVEIHRQYSEDVNFKKNYFDWIYVDGNHSYEHVKKDLEHFLPFMKKGGFICGDDYGWTDADCPIGPKKAVDEFAEKYNFPKKIDGNQFVINCC